MLSLCCLGLGLCVGYVLQTVFIQHFLHQLCLQQVFTALERVTISFFAERSLDVYKVRGGRDGECGHVAVGCHHR